MLLDPNIGDFTMSPSPLPLSLSLSDANATTALGRHLGQTLVAGSVLLLAGELGSGKTTLVQGIGAGLGIAEAIDSPTFTLVNEYLTGRLPLYHLDLYRLSADEVQDLCLETYWEGQEIELGIVAIEWAERLPYKPADYLVIQLIYEGDRRQAMFSPVGQFAWTMPSFCP